MPLTIGYDIENLTDAKIKASYKGEVTTDHYGRRAPKHAHGTASLECQTSSTRTIMKAMMDLYDRIINPDLLIRRVTVVADHLVDEKKAVEEERFEQMDMFTDPALDFVVDLSY